MNIVIDQASDLLLKFDLHKGTYATTVLSELAEIGAEIPPGNY